MAAHSRFTRLQQLLTHDLAEPLEWEELDTQLWLLLCERRMSPFSALGLPPEVLSYYASRYVQWEVGNGGFVQAMDNVSEWFPLAAEGCRSIGFEPFAALIQRAWALARSEPDSDALNLALERLDDELAGVEWEIDEQRVAWVRRHREVFMACPAAEEREPPPGVVTLEFGWTPGLELEVEFEREEERHRTDEGPQHFRSSARWRLRVEGEPGGEALRVIAEDYLETGREEPPPPPHVFNHRPYVAWLTDHPPTVRVTRGGAFLSRLDAATMRTALARRVLAAPNMPEPVKASLFGLATDEAFTDRAEESWNSFGAPWAGTELELGRRLDLSGPVSRRAIPGQDIDMKACLTFLGWLPTEQSAHPIAVIEMLSRVDTGQVRTLFNATSAAARLPIKAPALRRRTALTLHVDPTTLIPVQHERVDHSEMVIQPPEGPPVLVTGRDRRVWRYRSAGGGKDYA